MAIERTIERNSVINVTINLRVNDVGNARIKRLERLIKLKRLINIGL